MADVLMKTIRKKTLRTKESLRETFGKVDRTTDEQFEDCCNDFNKQQKDADRLQKELKNYVTCLKSLNQASKGFYEAVRDVYEPHWEGVEHVKAITHSLEILWDEYLQKLNDDALTPLNFYCNQFADLKVKIDKRGRKIIDYDAARHAHNSVIAANKKDDSKLVKTKERLNIAKKLYTDINSELLSVLPNLYESRVGFTVNHLKCVFNADYHFHDDSAKLSRDIRQEMGKMNVDDYKLDTNVAQIINNSKASEVTIPEESSKNSTPDKSTSEDAEKIVTRENGSSDEKVTDQLAPEVSELNRPFPQNNETKPLIYVKQRTPSLDENNPFKHDQSVQNSPHKVEEKMKEEVITVAASEKPSESKSPLVLYKVRATHRYSAEDTDELSFEAGEVILVVSYENPDEQDEGWLNGVKESSGEKGVFPENFTKKI